MATHHQLVAPGPYQQHLLPRITPWGGHDDHTILMWGRDGEGTLIPIMWQVYCPGHGGTRINPDVSSTWLKGLPAECFKHGGNRCWYEEDCESTVPLFIFYNALDPRCWLVAEGKAYPRHKLLESVIRWMPNAVPTVLKLAQTFDTALTAASVDLREPAENPAKEAAQ
jgi:hypothetical protein